MLGREVSAFYLPTASPPPAAVGPLAYGTGGGEQMAYGTAGGEQTGKSFNEDSNKSVLQ